MTAEIRHQASKTLMVQANYRWSKWFDDESDTASSFFADNSQGCDLVAHAGRAFKLGYGEIVISHLCAMNRWDIEHAAAIVRKAMNVWIERSKKNWRIEVASNLIESYPELAALPGFVPPPILY